MAVFVFTVIHDFQCYKAKWSIKTQNLAIVTNNSKYCTGMVSTATNEGNHIYPWIPSTAIAMRLCDDTPTHCEEYCNQEDDGPDSSTSSEASSDSIKPSDIHMFSASSTLHGFKHIFAPHHSSLRRFSWVVSFIASLIFLIFQVSFKKSIACPI